MNNKTKRGSVKAHQQTKLATLERTVLEQNNYIYLLGEILKSVLYTMELPEGTDLKPIDGTYGIDKDGKIRKIIKKRKNVQ